MLGLSRTMTTILQDQRIRELKHQASFRWLILWLNAVGTKSFPGAENVGHQAEYLANTMKANIPGAFAPPVTFIAFGIQAKVRGADALNVTQAFTSLALVALVSGPAMKFLSAVPTVAASLGCFGRVQEYLLSESREDGRKALSDILSTRNGPENSQGDISGIPLQCLPGKPSVESKSVAISVRNAVIRPSKTSTFVHKDLNIEISKGSVNMIVGPVGSGKTLVAKALLGEVPCETGTILTTTRNIGYCSQVPWLLNSSIQDNICGMLNQGTAIDETWYQTVIRACALETDIQLLTEGDRTTIGTKGMTLGGGQKQRLALSRCLYARPEIVILDDVLSALDSRTEQMVVDRLLGKSGLFRHLGTTVITHSGETNYF